MSNSQWPQGAQGRDPRQPFGQQQPAPPSYEELAPPKRSNTTLFAVLGVVAVIAAIVLGMQFLGGPDPDGVASPAATTSVEPVPERTGNFIPFEGNGDGVFEILNYSWDGDRLNLRIKVEVEHGEYAFAVFAFTNETRLSYDPVDMRAFSASEEHPYEGDVTFLMPNADSTIVLTTPSGRVALNALPVKAS